MARLRVHQSVGAELEGHDDERETTMEKPVSAAGIALKSVQSISFPRSGHRLVYGLLRDYFGDGLSRCEYYHCCRSVPCKKGAVYLKNHDFELDLNNDPRRPHIVQIRRSAQSQMNAYFRFVRFPDQRYFFGEPSQRPTQPSEYIPDSAELMREYCEFVTAKRDFLVGFVRKWVPENTNPNTYFLEYTDLVTEPLPHMKSLIQWLAPGHPLDAERVAAVVDQAGISYKHSLAEDPLFMPDFNERFDVADLEMRPSGPLKADEGV